jgi:hypothetical protein
MVGILLDGFLMAAVGLRCSLSLTTATKAMTWTIALWLVSLAVVSVLALTIISLGMLVFFLFWLTSIQLGAIPPGSPPWMPMSFATAWVLGTNAVTLLITILLVVDTRLRFDRIAGRITGGAVEATVDAWLHGQPGRPVRLDGQPDKPLEPSVSALCAAGSDELAG